ncbi:hypothetical protein VTP01DRAFT_10700 [Rhizomucor pusillus]|uniref:uncharacterized protein n=1 Tax=Rhizomucor pusillus TaxID=4840 RepID=UPI0037432465
MQIPLFIDENEPACPRCDGRCVEEYKNNDQDAVVGSTSSATLYRSSTIERTTTPPSPNIYYDAEDDSEDYPLDVYDYPPYLRFRNDDHEEESSEDSLRRHPAPPTASTVQEKLECSICQDDLRNSENSNRPTTLPCYHTFHVTCIQPWLELSETCPIWYFIQKINVAKTAY